MVMCLHSFFGGGTNMYHMKMQINRRKNLHIKSFFVCAFDVPKDGRWAGENTKVKPGGESCILFTHFTSTMGKRINLYQPSSNVPVNKNVLFYYFGGEGTQ